MACDKAMKRELGENPKQTRCCKLIKEFLDRLKPLDENPGR